MWLDAVSAALLVDAATGTVFTSSVEYTAINLQKKHAHCDSCREGGQDELHVGVHRQFHFDTEDTEFILRVLTVQGPYVCLVWGFVWRIGSFGHEGVTQRRVPRSFRGSWGAGTHTGRGHTVKAFASSQVSTQEANKSKHREYGTTERERERFCAIGRD